jgi:hypothetical protein
MKRRTRSQRSRDASNGQLTAKNERWHVDLDTIAGVRKIDESVIEELDTLRQCSRHEETQEPKGCGGKGPGAERAHLSCRRAHLSCSHREKSCCCGGEKTHTKTKTPRYKTRTTQRYRQRQKQRDQDKDEDESIHKDTNTDKDKDTKKKTNAKTKTKAKAKTKTPRQRQRHQDKDKHKHKATRQRQGLERKTGVWSPLSKCRSPFSKGTYLDKTE